MQQLMDTDKAVLMLIARMLLIVVVAFFAYQLGHVRGEIEILRHSTCWLQEHYEVQVSQRYDHCTTGDENDK